MSHAPIKCPYCGGIEIYRFRCDSDWGGGSYYWTANDASCYKKQRNEDYRPDISLYHCASCDSFFEGKAVFEGFAMKCSTPSQEPFVSASCLQERLDNIRNAKVFSQKDYEKVVLQLKEQLANANTGIINHYERADNITGIMTSWVDDIEPIEKTLRELDIQEELLSHILAHDIQNPKEADNGSPET